MVITKPNKAQDVDNGTSVHSRSNDPSVQDFCAGSAIINKVSGRRSTIIHIGDACFPNSCHGGKLPGLLLIPEAKWNLTSVSRMTMYIKFGVNYYAFQVLITIKALSLAMIVSGKKLNKGISRVTKKW